MVALWLSGAAHRHGIYCPDCLPRPPEFERDSPGRWTKKAYADYLKTAHWQEFRRRALDYYGRKCYLCGDTGRQIDLHHNTYERLGGELISDVIPLCHDCHQGYEEWKR